MAVRGEAPKEGRAPCEVLLSEYMRAYPGAMSHSADAFDELSELVESSAKNEAHRTELLARIESVRDDFLKPRLLAFTAKGWAAATPTKPSAS